VLPQRNHLRFLLVLAVLAISGLLAACGGGGNSSTSSEATDSASSAESGPSKSELLAFPTAAPPKTPINKPLKEVPETGKSVIALQCELPVCATWMSGMEKAMNALEWKLQPIVFSSADPNQSLEQAVSQKPDFIAITGIPVAAMKPGMEAAHAANIPVVSCSTPEAASPQGFASQCNASLATDAEYISDWMIQDSGGAANILGVSIGSYPILGTETDYLSGPDFAKRCPGCNYETLDVTVEDVGAGSIPQKVVGYLQTHPETNYVFLTFGDLSIGLLPVLKSSGLSGNVQLVGAAATEAVIKEIPQTQKAWTVHSNEYLAWQQADAMARLSIGEELPQSFQSEQYVDAQWVVDSQEAVETLKGTGYEYVGPGNGSFEQELTELWTSPK
jgi:ribose transport system substrate-binding protein